MPAPNFTYTNDPAADYARWSDPLARDWDRHATRIDRRVRELRTNPRELIRAIDTLDTDRQIAVLQAYFVATMHAASIAHAVCVVIDQVVADEIPADQEGWIDD